MARTSLKAALGISSILLGSMLFGGCGSADDSTFEDDHQLSDGNGSGFGDPNAPPDPGDESSSGGVGDVGNVDPSSACATASEGAELAPINLVLMIDRSGSMSNGNNEPLRWQPVKSGLLTFLDDPSSHYISASLAFFPASSGGACQVSSYDTPVVPLTQLPNGAAFTAAFQVTPDGSNTPTKPALEGAIETAKAIKASGKHVAVILATDGQPNGCDSNLSSVKAAAAAGLAEGIKTYVVGVGPSTGNLDDFAQAGGTGQAIMIPTNNAAQVSEDIRTAVGQIAQSLLGCNYPLPAPPDGQALDVNAVNVNYTPPGGTAETLPYSADCSNANGWRYDDTTAPKEIILCSDICDTAKNEAGAKLDIIFGCATQVTPGGKDPGVK